MSQQQPYPLISPDDSYFGLVLTTYRDHTDEGSFFQYECLVAAISVAFSRWTIRSHPDERMSSRFLFAALLGFLAFSKKSYELLCAVHLFSYAVPMVLRMSLPAKWTNNKLLSEKLWRLLFMALSAAISFVFSHLLLTYWHLVGFWIPPLIRRGLDYLFPIQELSQAYKILAAFVPSPTLQQQLSHLFFVTFHIQVAVGYLGIDFLRQEQARRNELVRMDVLPDETDQSHGNGHSTQQNHSAETPSKLSARQEASKRFQKGAAPFILLVAIPYMLQIIAVGNVNRFAYLCVQHDIHRAIRLHQLFENDEHLVAMANDSATSPAAYASSMDSVVSTAYELFNRKLFSLPKLLLLPAIMMKQPMLVVKIAPFIFGSDVIKGRIVAYMTTTSERLETEAKKLQSVRTKVEAFDMKNAELLQRSGRGATHFTHKKWEALTVRIQQKKIVSDLLKRTKGFFQFIQRNFIFTVLIDCALANLIAVGKIVSAEIFVFSRAIEDAVDLVLMRSRAESELAHMMTEVNKLQELVDVWDSSKSRALLPCTVAAHHRDSPGIVIRNLHYSRGTAMVRSDHVEFPPGVYALTGVNGSGKSTLFRVLMSCETNEKSIDLPSSIMLSTPMEPFVEKDDILGDYCPAADGTCQEEPDADEEDVEKVIPAFSLTMPSSHVVEISQTFYWPLYTRPIDWIHQRHLSDGTELEKMARQVAEELQSLQFTQAVTKNVTETTEESGSQTDPGENAIARVMQELLEEKEDWFNDLSGGQKSKVELVRKVFLQEKCPSVLLIDETMAPLDPDSKSLVMSKIKTFCRGSVVIVIYHTDVRADDGAPDCVPSNDFFDHNIHLVNHTLVKRPVC